MLTPTLPSRNFFSSNIKNNNADLKMARQYQKSAARTNKKKRKSEQAKATKRNKHAKRQKEAEEKRRLSQESAASEKLRTNDWILWKLQP